MKLNHLLGAACVAALSIGTANAGVIDAIVTDVNCPGGVPQMDDNSDVAFAGTPADVNDPAFDGCYAEDTIHLESENPDEVTIEEAIVALSGNRITNDDDKPALTHVEVEVFEDAGDGTPGFPVFNGEERVKIDIELTGAEWKVTASPNTIVRPGRDRLFSESAVGIANDKGNDGNGRFVEGNNETTFFLTPNNDSESTIGFSLPVRMTSCTDFSVEFTITDIEGNIINTRTADTDVVECAGDSVSGGFFADDVSVDVGEDDPFELFLEPDGTTLKGFSAQST